MKSNLKKMSIIAALMLSGLVLVATGCGGHPAYKLKDGESSKVRIIEKDGKLVKLEVNQDAVTEVALAAEDKAGNSGCKIKGLGTQMTEGAIKPENELKKEKEFLISFLSKIIISVKYSVDSEDLKKLINLKNSIRNNVNVKSVIFNFFDILQSS